MLWLNKKEVVKMEIDFEKMTNEELERFAYDSYYLSNKIRTMFERISRAIINKEKQKAYSASAELSKRFFNFDVNDTIKDTFGNEYIILKFLPGKTVFAAKTKNIKNCKFNSRIARKKKDGGFYSQDCFSLPVDVYPLERINPS